MNAHVQYREVEGRGGRDRRREKEKEKERESLGESALGTIIWFPGRHFCILKRFKKLKNKSIPLGFFPRSSHIRQLQEAGGGARGVREGERGGLQCAEWQVVVVVT